MPGAKGTKRPRKRGKFHIENPTKDDCLWCSKSVGAASAVRCCGCDQAYHKKCAVQCGSIVSTGAYRKCCDPTFKPQQVCDNDVAYSDDDASDSDGNTSDSSDSDSTIEDQTDSTITKKDLLSLSKSIKSAIRRSKKSLVKRIDTLSAAVNNVTAIATQNKADIAQIKNNLKEQNNAINAVSDSCNTNTAKINSIEDSINNIQKSSSSSSDMEQLYMEFNDRQSRKNNLMLFEVSDHDNSEEDSAYMGNFFKKVADFDPSKTKFRRCGLYNKKVHIKKGRPIQITFQSRDDYFKVLNAKKSTLKGFKLFTDKTEKQRSYINKVVKEVKQLNSDNPNSEKIIKYKFDVPIIAEKSKNLQVDQRAMHVN